MFSVIPKTTGNYFQDFMKKNFNSSTRSIGKSETLIKFWMQMTQLKLLVQQADH